MGRSENVGKKYIIELEDNESVYKTIIANGYPMIQVIVPAPYAEPDMEQVRKEAYDKGYDDAAEEKYNDGLADAWECARKVSQVRKYGGYGDCLEEVFGRHRVPWDVFDYSASECIEKIRQYEQKQEEQMQIGDEVIRHYKNEFMEGDDAPSIFLSEEDGNFRCLAFNGRSIMIAEYPKNQYRKTGRHFPEIAEVLQKMKES
jgi:hypothetical protein